MKKSVINLLIILFLLLLIPVKQSTAQVEVERTGAENPMVVIGKATLYGMGTGVLLGSAYSLASADANFGESVKWGFVAGTGGGFLIGAIYVLTRPAPSQSAMLNFEKFELTKVTVPSTRLLVNRDKITGVEMHLLEVNLR